MERCKGKVAVVTGTSSGIGPAICEALVASGLQVVGVARRKELIEEHASSFQAQSGVFHAVKADICKEEDILSAFKWITENVGPIHILINNAAICYSNGLLNGETSTWRSTFDTNVLGLCITTREAIKIMRANCIDGHIIHINSIAATKHAVTTLTETLRQELISIESKIKITSISPGLVNTEKATSGNMTEEQSYNLKTGCFLHTNDIADAVCYVLSTPPHVQIHELTICPTSQIF